MQYLCRPFSLWMFLRAVHFGVFARKCQIIGRSLSVALNDGLRLFVGETAVAANHRLCYFCAQHVRFVVHLKDHGISQFLFVRTQRTNEIAQTFGEHRYGAVHQVNTRSTTQGFLVNHAIFQHIVTHVGNVYTHFPRVVCETANGECIVKIFRIAWVDGESRNFTKIFTFSDFFFRNAWMEFVGSTFHVFGIGVGQSILCQNSVHLRVVFALLSEHVHHFTTRTLSVFGPIHDFHNRFVARLSAVEQVARNEDVGTDLSFGEQEPIAVMFHVKTSHKGVFSATNDFHHFSFASVTATTCHHRHAHQVAIESVVSIEFRHEDILAAIARHKNVVSIAFAAERALDELCRALCMTIIPFLIGGEKIV